MATVAQLSADWATLAAECRRRDTTVRLCIEKAQQLAQKLAPQTPVSESTEYHEIFTRPFFAALESGHERLMAVALLQTARLAAAKAFSGAQIGKLLDALGNVDCAAYSMDMQLKVLQVLPPVMQNYGATCACFLQVVRLLAQLSLSSVGVVANAASATLQQVFCTLFDQLKVHTRDPAAPCILVRPLPGEDALYSLDPLEHTCYATFADLCAAAGGKPLEIFHGVAIAPAAALEDIESLLSLHSAMFFDHPELAALLRARAVPALLKVLRNTAAGAYALVVRALRIVGLLATRQLPNVEVETEIMLLYTNHIVLSTAPHPGPAPAAPAQNMAYPLWERVLVVEMYRGLFSNYSNVRALYETYDRLPHKKNVLCEVFAVLAAYVGGHHARVAPSDRVYVGADPAIPVVSRRNSTLAAPLIDHLDKTDPPASVPDFYMLGLVLGVVVDVCNGATDFVAGMSANVDSDTIESEVEFATLFNEAVFSELRALFDRFLRLSIDAELFHELMAALQRYAHAMGLLGLGSVRNQLLLLFARCVCAQGAEQRTAHAGQDAGGAREPATGHNPATEPDRPPALTLRTFQERQIVSLAALLKLAGSLGSTLGPLWKIVLLTLQWVDYFINGPEDHSMYNSLRNAAGVGHPTLLPRDLAELEAMRLDAYRSVLQYLEETVLELLSVASALVACPMRVEEAGLVLEPCAFNGGFYVKLVGRVGDCEFRAFDVGGSRVRRAVAAFFAAICADRAAAAPYRLLLATSYAQFVLGVTARGFKNGGDGKRLAEHFLADLRALLDQLLALGEPPDHHAASCELRVRLAVLETLHDHINQYDTQYYAHWGEVFLILNSVFEPVANTRADPRGDEQMRQLVVCAFETLKMVLDQFVALLAPQRVQPLIGTLVHFCQQDCDLNIVFAAISYFWPVSDSLRAHISAGDAEPPVFRSVEELEQLLLTQPGEAASHYNMLHTYLLARLAGLARDRRPQVRESAAQTLFQILDVQAQQRPLWESVLHMVLPSLLECDDVRADASALQRKAAMASVALVLDNLVALYSRHMTQFERESHVTAQFWTHLLAYLLHMIRVRWCELSLRTFQAFLELLGALREAHPPPELANALYCFWADAPIEYDFVNVAYADALVAYLGALPALVPLLDHAYVAAAVPKIVSNVNKCARYPVLKANQKDQTAPTALQQAAIESLLWVADSTRLDDTDACVVQQLAHMVAYPVETRLRIEAKLAHSLGARVRIPSFEAVSQAAFDALVPRVARIEATRVLFADARLHRVIKSLLFLVRTRAPGVPRTGADPLWVACNVVILDLLQRAIADCRVLTDASPSVWELVVDAVQANFGERLRADETHSVRMYELLAQTVLPALLLSGTEHVARFTATLYAQSFLYDTTAEERALMGGEPGADAFDARAAFDALCAHDFSLCFGTTEPLWPRTNQRMRLMCVDELFRVCDDHTLVLVRIAFALRRFVADNRLLKLQPLPHVQQTEVLAVVRGLGAFQLSLDMAQRRELWRLVAACVPYAERIGGLGELLQPLVQ